MHMFSEDFSTKGLKKKNKRDFIKPSIKYRALGIRIPPYPKPLMNKFVFDWFIREAAVIGAVGRNEFVHSRVTSECRMR